MILSFIYVHNLLNIKLKLKMLKTVLEALVYLIFRQTKSSF